MTKNPITGTAAALAAILALTGASAFAQQHEGHGGHGGHGGGDHGAQQHDHDHDTADADADEAQDAGADGIGAAEGRTITARVHGMVCDFCARSLTKVLGKNDAVEDVAIDLTDKTVTILVKEGETLSDEAVREAVTHAGYNLAALERS